MVKKCLGCGRGFVGVERKFCSWQCEETCIIRIQRRLEDAMKNDKSHTERLGSQ